MYIVTIQNGNIRTEIHGENQSVLSGKIAKGINAIDSFTMSLHPANAGFDKLQDFQTLVDVYNTRKNRYEFFGRVLYSSDGMDESGLITREATCESFFGFLCDSEQYYVTERNWTVNGLFSHLIDVHNAQIEGYKKFKIGEITVTDPNDNLYLGIQRKNTWETIKEKLLDKLGGEIRFRVVENEIYIDYLVKIGETKQTAIELSRNMKSIMREKNPAEYVTRLIPLGAKLGNDTEERLDITSVNNGKNYIEDEEAVKKYGIHVKSVEFDDVTEARNLLAKGKNWLAENNRLKIKYTATALDLSILGLDIDDFDIFNSYPLLNSLLGIDDTARIIKKNIDVCEEVKSTIEFGEKFETLSDNVNKIKNYATQAQLESETRKVSAQITKTEENINAQIIAIEEELAYVSEINISVGEISASVRQLQTDVGYVEADLELKIGRDENDQIVSMINASADIITLNANRIEIDSDNFELSRDGTVTARAGVIGGCEIKDGVLQVPSANITGKLTAEQINATGLKVEAANITGSLKIGQLPDTVAETSDIPTKISELSNDSGYKTESGVVSIIDGRITADYVNALGISVYSAQIQDKLTADKIDVAGLITAGGLVIGDDIPTKISDLENDSDFEDYDGVVSIIDGRITADYIEALEIKVKAAQIEEQLTASQINTNGLNVQSGTIGGWVIGYDFAMNDTIIRTKKSQYKIINFENEAGNSMHGLGYIFTALTSKGVAYLFADIDDYENAEEIYVIYSFQNPTFRPPSEWEGEQTAIEET